MKVGLFIFLALFSSANLFAYPNFIGHGYQACLNCHYNPFGNGPLTDYGRAVAATAISGRWPISSTVSEETLADRSAFFGTKPKQQWFRPSIDYRGMYLKRGVNKDTPSDPAFIHMQNDANVVLKFGDRDQYVASFTYGYIPSNSTTTRQTRRLSREHYVGYRWSKEMGLYLGKMDKVFGLRVPDHTAFSRQMVGATQNAQTHGAVFHWAKSDFDFGLQYFIGDLEVGRSARSKGLTASIEKTVFGDIRVGGSIMNESYTDRTNQVMALHLRAPVGYGSSIMFETGRQNKTMKSNSAKTTGQYFFLQNHLRMGRGVYYLTTLEYQQADLSNKNETYRIAPGFQIYPVQRMEVRLELSNTRVFSSQTAPQDSWDFIGQVHVWL